MADVQEFFTSYLPHKLSKKPDLAKEINTVYQFNLGDAGNWVVDLTVDGGEVREGTADNPDCVVEAKGKHFAALLDNPASAMVMLATRKLKVSSMSAGMALQKLFA